MTVVIRRRNEVENTRISCVCNERRHQCFQCQDMATLTSHPDVFEATVLSLPTSAARVEVVTDRLIIFSFCTEQTTSDDIKQFTISNHVRRYQNSLRYQTTSDDIKTVYDIKPRPAILKQFTISNHVRRY